jgi:hypothetical protein
MQDQIPPAFLLSPVLYKNDFIESNKTLFWMFLTKRQPKIVKTIRAQAKGTVLMFRIFKTNIHHVTLSL